MREDLLSSAVDGARKHAQSCAYAPEDAYGDRGCGKGGKEGEERARDTHSCKTMTCYFGQRGLARDSRASLREQHAQGIAKQCVCPCTLYRCLDERKSRCDAGNNGKLTEAAVGCTEW